MNNTLTALAIAATVGIYYYYWQHDNKTDNDQEQLEREVLSEPESSLLRNHSQYRTIRGHRLRIVYIPCPSSTLPLLVFIHGLGGQAEQWEAQLAYFSKRADVLALDMLGCGQSQVTLDWSSYRTCSLVQDVASLLASFSTARSIVLIAHSYGCAIASYLAALPEWQPVLRGLILISPKESMTDSQKRGQKLIQWIPDWLMDRGRRADRQGGLNSKSVTRFLRPDTDVQHKRKQLKWNLMSRTPVYKCFVTGLELPDQSTYAKIQTRVLMIGGTKDGLVPPSDMNLIYNHLLKECHDTDRVQPPVLIEGASHMPMVTHSEQVNLVISNFLSLSE